MGQRDVRTTMRRARCHVDRLGPALMFVVLVAVSSCGIGWKDQPISTVEVRDERTLVVGFHCDHDSNIDAEETTGEVRVTFRVYGGNRGECAESEEVRLAAPLGGRTIIDTSTGERVVPCRPSASPDGQPCI